MGVGRVAFMIKYNLGRHTDPTHVAVKKWIDEFCLICLLVFILIYRILLLFCCIDHCYLLFMKHSLYI